MADQTGDAAPQTEGTGSDSAPGFLASRRAATLAALQSHESKQAPAASPAVAPPPEASPAAATPTTGADPAKQPDPPADDLAAIRKQEIHLRRQFAEEKARWEQDRNKEQGDIKPKLDRLAQLEAALGGGDAVALLQLAGYKPEADFDHLSRLIWAHTPEGSKDPKNRVTAHQTRAQREAADELRQLKTEMTEWKRDQEKARQEAARRAQVDQYYETVSGAIGDTSPHARYLLGKNPRGAQSKLLEHAARLYHDSGPADDLREDPTPGAVLKAYETARLSEIKDTLAELAALGIDPMTLMPAPAKTAPAAGSTAAAPVRPSTTLSPNGSAPTQVARTGRKSRDELIQEVQRMHSAAKP